MNTVILIGNLARDPELRYTANGKAVTNLTVAVNRGYGKNNEADFIRVVVWEKQAENCANYLAKGRKVAVQGRLQVSSYEAKDGSTRYNTDVVANVIEFLGGDNSSTGSSQAMQRTSSPEASSDFNPEEEINVDDFKAMDDDEDLPF
ncbi:single-stranded DNA-binding protein [Tindallia californiensis]|uniref:Single-stranded DNA-binding protein n=1 Tax=Tindallia californiensis TaxID=159292 RepID=A0A1H3MBG9_9FIRM|nr:single-stranded DNA-binding protein [Tindallia californiensis]SDY73549.1 single-strand binding protein [Tindallia californiensis]